MKMTYQGRKDLAARALREAGKILAERRLRVESGEPQLTAAEALRRVSRVSQPAGSGRETLDPVRLAGGQDLVSGTYEPGKGWQPRIRVPETPVAIGELSDALSAMIVRHWPHD